MTDKVSRHTRILLAAERRYSRRAKAYESGRRSPVFTDTLPLAQRLIEADRLVRRLLEEQR